jgi:hypothetical protein
MVDSSWNEASIEIMAGITQNSITVLTRIGQNVRS